MSAAEFSQEIAALTRNGEAKLVTTAKIWRGRHFVDVRLWVNGFPTAKGITLRVDEAESIAGAISRGVGVLCDHESRKAKAA